MNLCDRCGIPYTEDLIFLRTDALQTFCDPCFSSTKNLFSCCGGKGTATWDQANQNWKCTDCGTPQSTDPSYIGGSHTPDTNDMWYNKKSTKVCECGADKTYGKGNNMHSATMPCPLYVKP